MTAYQHLSKREQGKARAAAMLNRVYGGQYKAYDLPGNSKQEVWARLVREEARMEGRPVPDHDSIPACPPSPRRRWLPRVARPATTPGDAPSCGASTHCTTGHVTSLLCMWVDVALPFLPSCEHRARLRCRPDTAHTLFQANAGDLRSMGQQPLPSAASGVLQSSCH